MFLDLIKFKLLNDFKHIHTIKHYKAACVCVHEKKSLIKLFDKRFIGFFETLFKGNKTIQDLEVWHDLVLI